jgi:hypothetical protein
METAVGDVEAPELSGNALAGLELGAGYSDQDRRSPSTFEWLELD